MKTLVLSMRIYCADFVNQIRFLPQRDREKNFKHREKQRKAERRKKT